MRGPPVYPIVIAAGGTGGHFFPAEALASELVRRGQRIVLMTDSRSGGLTSAVFADQERHVLHAQGVAGRAGLSRAKSAMELARGALQARKILSRLTPSAVVGFGGYPCVPPVTAARLLMRRPAIILHEQNAVLGRANRSMARFASTLALSYAGTTLIPPGTNTVVTGNPIRPSIAAVAGRGYEAPTDEVRLVVLGGSLGARVFSDVVPQALGLLPENLRRLLRVVQQCRPEDLERVRAAYLNPLIPANLSTFFDDPARLLDGAHLLITRAGASTVAELAAVGRPAILVPLPDAIDDHQTANARALANAGGAWLMPQPEFTPETLAERLRTLLTTPSMLADAAGKAAALGQADAAGRLADLVEQTIGQESRA